MPPEDDDELWNKVTEDIEPLSKPLRAPIPPSETRKKTKKLPPIKEKNLGYIPSTSPNIPSQSKELDRRTAKNLERGKIRIEGRIDLHGMIPEQAQHSLTRFLIDAHSHDKRCILVITGKGKGILKSYTQEWLNLPPLNNIVLKNTHAQAKDGGTGAFYVYLRRKR